MTYCSNKKIFFLSVIDFHNSDAIRLRFISNSGQYSGIGFKISIEQIDDSCRNPRTFSYLNTNFNTGASYRPAISNLKVCGVFRDEQFNIESPNYPLTYSSDTHCLYRICKSNPTVNSLEIFFNDFSVGTMNNNFCSNDYLEINGERYCGYLKNQHLFIDFPANLNIMNIRFRSNERENHLGFKLIIKQISTPTNQTSNMIGTNFNILGLNTTNLNVNHKNNGFKHLNLPISNNRNDLHYYNQNVAYQLSSSNNVNCLPKFFNQKNFYLTSPGYRNKNYPCSMQCNYWVSDEFIKVFVFN